MIEDNSAKLGQLLTLEQEIRQARTMPEFTTIACNRSREIIDFTQSALAILGPSGSLRIIGFSDIAVVDRTAPLVSWLETELKHVEDNGLIIEPSSESRETVADLVPEHILIVPLVSATKGLLGAFITTRTSGFSEDERSVLGHLGSVFGQALATHNNTPTLLKIRSMLSGRRKWGIAAIVLLAMLLPVRLSSVAPAEITAVDPFIVAPPMQGVIEKVLVKPNESVQSGQPLLKLVDVELKSNLTVAQRAFRIAQAELLRGRQLAFSNQDEKAQLAELAAQVELRRAEMNFAQDQLSRATVTAPNDGLIMLDDPRKWMGRPVATGEQIMKLANPQLVEVEVHVPVTDAITLSEGSRVDVFLDIDPTTRHQGIVTRVPYQSSVSAAGVLSYRVKAELSDDKPAPRIGLRGSARVRGPSTTLFYFLFRRPITVVRQILGV